MRYEYDVLRVHVWVPIPYESLLDFIRSDATQRLECAVSKQPEKLLPEIARLLEFYPKDVREALASRVCWNMSKVKAATLGKPKSSCRTILLPGYQLLIKVRLPLLSGQVDRGDVDLDYPITQAAREMLHAA